MISINISKYFALVATLLCFLLIECNEPVSENDPITKNEVIIDSANAAWFNCYINNQKWEKSDLLSATLSVRSDNLLLNVNCDNNSVTYQKVSLLIPLGKVSKNINKQLVQLLDDTLLASIIYSFAEIDYSSETPIPVNHMAFEMKPSALVCITKVDTLKNSIDGTFKAYAEDELKRKHVFKNGIFRNLLYKKIDNVM